MDKIDNIGLTRMLTQAYDFDGFTTQEVWSRIAQRMNIIVELRNFLLHQPYLTFLSLTRGKNKHSQPRSIYKEVIGKFCSQGSKLETIGEKLKLLKKLS